MSLGENSDWGTVATQGFPQDDHEVILKLSIPGVFQEQFHHVGLDPHLLSGADSATAEMLRAVKRSIKDWILVPVRNT